MPGANYARFRVSSAGKLGYTGAAAEGEVDYIGSNTLVTNVAGATSSWSILPSGSITTPTFVADVHRNGTLDLIQSKNLTNGN